MTEPNQKALSALAHKLKSIPDDNDLTNEIDRQFYTGVIALLKEELNAAESTFLSVLSLDATHADARTNLGVIALRRGQSQQAITYFSEALGFDETHENARNNLAATFIHHNRFENARTHYTILIKDHPNNPEYHYNAGVAEMALGHLNEARAHFKSVLTQNPTHGPSLTNLASIASRLNQTASAVRYLKRATKVNPHDKSSAFMLDALTQNHAKHEASPEYAKNLFDNYALHYEKHMQDTLNYSVPHHVAQLLHQILPNTTLTTQNTPLQVDRALDLGCGTGLSGVVLRELSHYLAGVDLSPKMLEEAKQKGIYDALYEADIITFLNEPHPHFSLIVAADVLPYLGELDTLFQAIQKNIAPSGLFLFTTEMTSLPDFILQKTARFAHHPDYIASLATQYRFNILQQKTFVARQQDDKGLEVTLYVLQSI
ncbi:MAG: tetratricopeptide repeat protein [Legionellaceae bacterium]|nr:tetratricopeptide repeat protein [Legionellaceae bacterium]